MTEFQNTRGIETENSKQFEVIKYPCEGGFVYVIYFPTEQAASDAITGFWNGREKSQYAKSSLSSGMFTPIKHPTYTEGDRTHSFLVTSPSEKHKHPGMLYKVEFNGNEGALRPQGEESLRKLGFIE